MKFRISFLALVFLVGVAGSSIAQPAAPPAADRFSLDQPVTIGMLKGVRPDAPAAEAARLIAPLEEWRQKANGLTRQAAAAADAKADFDHVVTGIRFRASGKAVVDDYLDRLPPERLQKMFEEGRTKKNGPQIYETALARKKMAEAVLARPGLAKAHPDAEYEKGLMTFVCSTDFNEIRAAFQSAESRAKGSDNAAVEKKARGAAAALTNPQAPEDYEETIALLDVSSDFGLRVQGTCVSDAVTRKLKAEGVAAVDPARFNGDDTPLRAAARAAFEMGYTTITDPLVDLTRATKGLSESTRVEMNYWAGMNQYANGHYDRAIPFFEANLASSESTSYLAACSCYRLAQTYHDMRKYANAGVYYYACEKDFAAYPEVSEEGHKGLDFLIRSGALTEGAFQSALKQHQQKQELAMSTESAREGGR